MKNVDNNQKKDNKVIGFFKKEKKKVIAVCSMILIALGIRTGVDKNIINEYNPDEDIKDPSIEASVDELGESGSKSLSNWRMFNFQEKENAIKELVEEIKKSKEEVEFLDNNETNEEVKDSDSKVENLNNKPNVGKNSQDEVKRDVKDNSVLDDNKEEVKTDEKQVIDQEKVEENIDKPTEKSEEKPVDKSEEKPTDKIEKPTDDNKNTDKSEEKPSVKPDEPAITPGVPDVPDYVPDEPGHYHHYIEKSFITCNQDGTHTETFTKSCECGDYEVTNEIKSDCDYKYNEITDDYEYIECMVCGYKTTREHNIVKSMPDENGVINITCSNPGCTYHKTEIEKEECTHDYVVSVKTVSNEDGTHTITTTKTCKLCNKTIVEPKTVDCDYEVETNNDAKISTCKVCSYKLVEEHSYDETELENGDRVEVCSKCGHSYTIEHEANYQVSNYVDNNDGTHSYTIYCDNCGHKTEGVAHPETTETKAHEFTGDGLEQHCICGATKSNIPDIPIPPIDEIDDLDDLDSSNAMVVDNQVNNIALDMTENLGEQLEEEPLMLTLTK